MNVKYTFWVKGAYPDGNRGKMSGEVVGPDGYPFSVFEEAVAACLRLTPDLVVNLEKPGNVVLRKKKQ